MAGKARDALLNTIGGGCVNDMPFLLTHSGLERILVFPALCYASTVEK